MSTFNVSVETQSMASAELFVSKLKNRNLWWAARQIPLKTRFRFDSRWPRPRSPSEAHFRRLQEPERGSLSLLASYSHRQILTFHAWRQSFIHFQFHALLSVVPIGRNFGGENSLPTLRESISHHRTMSSPSYLPVHIQDDTSDSSQHPNPRIIHRKPFMGGLFLTLFCGVFGLPFVLACQRTKRSSFLWGSCTAWGIFFVLFCIFGPTLIMYLVALIVVEPCNCYFSLGD